MSDIMLTVHQDSSDALLLLDKVLKYTS